MKTILYTLSLLIFTTIGLSAQSSVRVYEILQEKCASCHSNASPQSGLDLEGSGASVSARALQVYNNLVNVTPANSAAANKGDKYVYPGRADKSFLFRKINKGLETTYHLGSGEEDNMPPENSPQLTDVEKELVRQWILFGAPLTGTVVPESRIEDYYNVNGMPSFPDGAPEAPDPSEGFQIKMGPFYLPPSGELEYFHKWKLDLPANVDVNRIDIEISSFSHHFIIYNFNPGGDNTIPSGLRLNPDHSDISLVAAVQEGTDLRLPEGTAFIWDNDLVLDLNSHYINYSAAHTLQAEVYVNVYTQEAGSAAQEMFTELVVNDDIFIPNNGNPVTEEQHINSNFGEVFLWGVMGHTHQYGTGYKAWKRQSAGAKGDLIYDAACPNGVPGCVSPFFDYQHIPIRYFDSFLPITFNFLNGMIHEASWINDGPNSVGFGPTSDDEMMVMVLMYVEDTTGVTITDVHEFAGPLEEIKVYPNPAQEEVTVEVPAEIGAVTFRLFDLTGKELQQMTDMNSTQFRFLRRGLPAGMYLYRIEDDRGRSKAGKLIFR